MKAYIALLLISSCQSMKLSQLNEQNQYLQSEDKATWENSGWITPSDNGLGDEEVIGSFDPKTKKKECKESKKIDKDEKEAK